MSTRSLPARGAWSAAAIGALTASLLAAPAAATAAPAEAPPGIPAAAPPAAFLDEPELAAPAAWPFSEAFSRTSGTARHDDGALLWTDWLFDDTGDGSLTYADEAAHANGADVFRAGIGDAASITLRVTTDGPTSLLVGAETIDLPEGSHTLGL